MQPPKTFQLDQAVKAQQALRNLANLPPETFPVQAFVGMISDEIEHLRKQGHSDQKIAQTISASSNIQISAEEIAENYAPPEERRPHSE